MFTNLSNHPSRSWPAKEYEKASQWGQIQDFSFPYVSPAMADHDILKLAVDCIRKLPPPDAGPVLVSGEYALTYALVDSMLDAGYTILCAKSDIRLSYKTKEDGATEKKLEFLFRDFAEYVRYPEETAFVNNHEPILLNCSMNYPSWVWDENATSHARKYGKIIDLPIAPLPETQSEMFEKTREYLQEIDRIRPAAVLLDGDFRTFYLLANVLMRKGYPVLVKCSERISTETLNPDGTVTKLSTYRFVKYRNCCASHNDPT